MGLMKELIHSIGTVGELHKMMGKLIEVICWVCIIIGSIVLKYAKSLYIISGDM